CEATSHPALSSAIPLVPYVYAIPYLLYSPNYCFVLVSDSSDIPNPNQTSIQPTSKERCGNVVGFILGTPSTIDFVSGYASGYNPELPKLEPSSAVDMLTRDALRPERMLVGLESRWPAHLHINILPGWQGGGWGAKLIDTLLEKLKSEGVRGVHLGMAEDNDGAGRFYKRCGFQLASEIPE
ncbi:hypothetical protein BZA77DRAFT_224530, partial [Pyronema omphalodes]